MVWKMWLRLIKFKGKGIAQSEQVTLQKGKRDWQKRNMAQVLNELKDLKWAPGLGYLLLVFQSLIKIWAYSSWPTCWSTTQYSSLFLQKFKCCGYCFPYTLVSEPLPDSNRYYLLRVYYKPVLFQMFLIGIPFNPCNNPIRKKLGCKEGKNTCLRSHS